ncbi:hypothetical protein [Zongyangia hominis]|uniref:Gram-positive cocci surface proteins LPxTG domain-containing protein n=1 Tax=Zongyangia hominis TaxID=2763677 RepID=A0A926EDZ5_9FIRM|nr:hypothetical protein [Zongyangia hominis]MBC8570444.1 hypothetical protein [Zongyangia hominis]
MKKKLMAVILCMVLAFTGVQTAIAAPVIRMEEQSAVTTSAPQSTTTLPETNSDGRPKTTREQDIAIVVLTFVGVIGMIMVIIEKRKKNDKGPLRK